MYAAAIAGQAMRAVPWAGEPRPGSLSGSTRSGPPSCAADAFFVRSTGPGTAGPSKNVEGGPQIGQQVVDRLQPDRQSQQVPGQAAGRVRHRRRLLDERLDGTERLGQGEELGRGG